MEHRLDYAWYNGEINALFPKHCPASLSPDLKNDQAIDSSKGCQDGLRGVFVQAQRRRKRTTFSKGQLCDLERAFALTHYPDVKLKETLAAITGLPESKIQVWFQNRRARHFRSKKQAAGPVAADPTAQRPGLKPATPLPPHYPSPNLPEPSRVSQGWCVEEQPLCVPASTSPVPAHLVMGSLPASLSPSLSPEHSDKGRSPNSTTLWFENTMQQQDMPYWVAAPCGTGSSAHLHASAGVGGSVCYSQQQMNTRVSNYSEADQTVPTYHQQLQYHHQADWGSHRVETGDDTTDLCSQNYKDFSLTDLEFSTALMDYLL